MCEIANSKQLKLQANAVFRMRASWRDGVDCLAVSLLGGCQMVERMLHKQLELRKQQYV